MQLEKKVEHPNQTQPNPGLRADESPCSGVDHILSLIPYIEGPFDLCSVHRSRVSASVHKQMSLMRRNNSVAFIYVD